MALLHELPSESLSSKVIAVWRGRTRYYENALVKHSDGSITKELREFGDPDVPVKNFSRALLAATLAFELIGVSRDLGPLAATGAAIAAVEAIQQSLTGAIRDLGPLPPGGPKFLEKAVDVILG